MEWYHKTDPIWMGERAKYVTASQMKSMVPLTPTGRVRDTSKAWLAWLGDYKRTSPIDDDECITRGAAARGHVLEPWAIKVFDHYMTDNRIKGHAVHVDDVLITKNMIGWSPDGIFDDGTNMKYLNKVRVSVKDVPEFKPTIGIEVKSYNEANHYATAFCDKMSLEERWQIATAFYVCSSLRVMYLVLYNPEVADEMFVNEYRRDDLAEELNVIAGVNSTAKLICGLRKLTDEEEAPKCLEKVRDPLYLKQDAIVGYDYICNDYNNRMMLD